MYSSWIDCRSCGGMRGSLLFASVGVDKEMRPPNDFKETDFSVFSSLLSTLEPLIFTFCPFILTMIEGLMLKRFLKDTDVRGFETTGDAAGNGGIIFSIELLVDKDGELLFILSFTWLGEDTVVIVIFL